MESKFLTPILNILSAGMRLLNSSAPYLQSLVLLAFRLEWGWKFFQTGWGKLMNHERVTEFFMNLGIPMPGLNAWVAASAECFGGLLLLIGLFSRPVGLVLLVNMTVAYVSVEADRAAFFGVFSNIDPFVQATPFFFWLTALLVLAFGPGKISLDALLRMVFCRKRSCDYQRQTL